MPRRPQVRYFKSRGAYFCQLNGRQHKLATGPDDAPEGPTFEAACRAFADLLSLANAPVARDQNTVRVVCEMYMRHLAGSARKPETLNIRQWHCARFCNAGYGEARVSELTPFMVQAYLEGKRRPTGKGSEKKAGTWGPGMARIAVQTFKAVFRWAQKAKLITSNPMEGLEAPGPRSRGRDCILTPEQHQGVIKHASRSFRPFVVVLENTGARPGEIAAATAADWRPDLGAFVYHGEHNRKEGEFSHKTGQKGKDRVIFVTGEALAIVEERVRRCPVGPLFLTERGNPWTPQRIAKRFRTLRGRTGIPRLTAYSYRHTFATRWLLGGRSIEVLAELMGNTPAVIRRHYSHLCGDLQGLRQQMEAFKAGEAAASPSPRLRVVGE